MKSSILIISIGLIAIGGCDNTVVDQPTVTTPSASPSYNMPNSATTRPDNTGINTRDRAPDAPTAGMQGQSRSDVEITADIRRRIMDGKMSINAQNSKVIYDDGKVTLRGPVNDQKEKDTIGRIAADVVGEANVDNQLEVTPK